ncbi:hypothetical protein Back11_36970 [Paenibacillus baekrokdamisoli]|uniref:Uncharacterized protein n=1 Tax=Paenibacillus baekrokdamisoli TaxID=1712516 RepID=A0A3G9IVQ1_9BACL|nr:DUF2834 domain-containing protein [Paenibacillus baekrokdamisoli]MBB3072596.1 hypothetical protein [Paenibacillus baekrokdamisoli]BBH22352.1 hypothetical protein Back11_36970 [Paenibacillus baekrokdamisoli]
MKREHGYLLLTFLGIVLPYWYFIPFLQTHGFDVKELVNQLFVNKISGFFAMDVIVSSVVLWYFILIEGKKLGMKRLWVYVIASLAVGVSLAFPLFLYIRERQKSRGV